jgi:radical SAM superfamily enzyme YgiQ (UPF0313 family)
MYGMKSLNSQIKIILIQPISIFSSAFDFKNTIVTHLLEIASQVNYQFRNNSDVSVKVMNLIDENIYKPRSIHEYKKHITSLTKFLLRFNTGEHLIFGISCFSSNYYISSIVLAKLIREIYPRSIICVGGYQVNYFPEEFVFPQKIYGGIIEEKLFDYIFLGESDFKFAEIVEYLIKTNNIRTHSDKRCQIIQSGLIEKLETLPQIDYSLMKIPDSPFISIPIYFSKGCPFNCAFCGDYRNIYSPKKRWRMISPQDAYIRLKTLIKHFEGISSQVQIFDPLWTYPEWRIKFYKILKENEISQEMWAEIRVDQYSPKETEFLKNLNLTIAFGLESADSRMLNIMKKTKNPKTYLSAFSSNITSLDKAGIYVICNILFGHPGETENSMNQTMDYIENISQKVQNMIPSVSKYMLIPGSEIYSCQSRYINDYHAKFHYPHYWTIPKCYALSSSMVDPSSKFTYYGVIDKISKWIPRLYPSCIKNFQKKRNRDFIFHRYLNQMLLGPRIYWEKHVRNDYDNFGKQEEVMAETSQFWAEII